MRHETGPQICSFCHAVSAFAVLKKVSCDRNVFSDIFSESSVLWIMEFSSLKCHYRRLRDFQQCLLFPKMFLAALSSLSQHFCSSTTRDWKHIS